MKISLKCWVLCLLFAGGPSLVFAEDNCGGNWQEVATRVPGSKVALTLSTTKEGEERLKWPNPNHDNVWIQANKTKGPPYSQGKVEVCTQGFVLTRSIDSISVRDLQAAHKLSPGYYIVSVSFPAREGDTSDFVTIQIKEPGAKKGEGGKH